MDRDLVGLTPALESHVLNAQAFIIYRAGRSS